METNTAQAQPTTSLGIPEDHWKIKASAPVNFLSRIKTGATSMMAAMRVSIVRFL
jgi:hypothetical protein